MREERRDVLAVPEKALRNDGGRRVVYVVNGESSGFRAVRVGRRGGGFIEILDGLKADERVVVYSQRALGPRSRVKVVERLEGVSP